jgi:hypothetical protein
LYTKELKTKKEQKEEKRTGLNIADELKQASNPVPADTGHNNYVVYKSHIK